MSDQQPVTRHEARFGITSFIYRARRPFHPGRLDDLILEPFFVMPDFMDDEEEESGEKVFSEEDREIVVKVLQKRAAGKQGCNSTSRKYHCEKVLKKLR